MMDPYATEEERAEANHREHVYRSRGQPHLHAFLQRLRAIEALQAAVLHAQITLPKGSTGAWALLDPLKIKTT